MRFALALAFMLAGPAMAQPQGKQPEGKPITVGFGMALTGGLAPNGKAALLAMQDLGTVGQREGRAARSISPSLRPAG